MNCAPAQLTEVAPRAPVNEPTVLPDEGKFLYDTPRPNCCPVLELMIEPTTVVPAGLVYVLAVPAVTPPIWNANSFAVAVVPVNAGMVNVVPKLCELSAVTSIGLVGQIVPRSTQILP